MVLPCSAPRRHKPVQYPAYTLVKSIMSAQLQSFFRMPAWLVLMGLITALAPLAIDMYLPAFPTIAADFGVGTALVERTLAGYLLGIALAQLVYGPLADRYGRRLPLLVGLSLFTAASVGACFSTSITDLTLWRVVQAFGGAAGMVIPRVVIRDQYNTQDSARAMSLMMMIMGVAPVVAPVLGGQFLLLWSWRSIFLAMALCAALLAWGVLRTMRETLPADRVTPLHLGSILRNYGQLLRDRQFLGYALAGGFGTASMFAYIAGSPRVLIGLFEVDPRVFGLLFGVNVTAFILASQISARMLLRHTPARLLRRAQTVQLGFAILGVTLTLTQTLTLPGFMFCITGVMAAQGFTNPNAAALSLDRQGHRLGVASAQMGALHMGSGALAGWSVSAWHSSSALPLTGTLAVCTLLSWGFGRSALRRQHIV